jgi:hypothetical protein
VSVVYVAHDLERAFDRFRIAHVDPITGAAAAPVWRLARRRHPISKVRLVNYDAGVKST